MRLQRLTGLEQEKIYDEMEELKNFFQSYKSIIADKKLLQAEIVKELEYLKKEYGDERKSKIEGPIDS